MSASAWAAAAIMPSVIRLARQAATPSPISVVAAGRIRHSVDARFPLKGMPDDAKALVHLGQSIVMVSFPVEVWKQPRVLDSGAAYIKLIKEPVV